MARIEITGIGIEYELLGEMGAPAVAVTPGGRFGKDSPGLREFGEALIAGGKRVLLWDRPNCGASDICFEGESEAELQARILIELIRALDLGPTALAGGSAGARTSLVAALRDPKCVSHLIQWWMSGGTVSLLMLGASYCCESAIAASMGGMKAVAELPTWAEQIKRNPRNLDIILKQDPVQFIATMTRWASAFIPSDTMPVPGLLPTEVDRLTMPVLIFRGLKSDLFHLREVSDLAHKLISHSEILDLPWSDDEYNALFGSAMKTGSGHFLDWPKLAPAVITFTSQMDN